MEPDKLGQDEWVAREEARRLEIETPWTGIKGRLRGLDLRLKVSLLLVVAALLPLLSVNDYQIRIGGTAALFVMLSLGLNVVVGFVGLLDLGYMAFYGIGAYTYALLASSQFNLHFSFWFILPLSIILTGLVGVLLGSSSLRLRGDYLAIATLGFGQIVGLLLLNLDRVNLPFLTEPVNFTGGPNGIVNLDDVRLFGYAISNVRDYYYLILSFSALTFFVVHHLNCSHIGRAWRAIREDELAAQAMGLPVPRLKLLAFSTGAAIAGAAGALFAAWQGAVFPPNFDVTLVITLYAMVILGGAGSLMGAISGAVILSILPELLRSTEVARLLFYSALVLAVLMYFRKRKMWGLALLAGVVLWGWALKTLAMALRPDLFVHSQIEAGLSLYTLLAKAVNAWMLIPHQSKGAGNVVFYVAFGLLLLAYRFKSSVRYALLVPGLHALAFVWETRLAHEPSITRLILYGTMLVLLMNYRPQGLFGQKRVERT